jgi:hypothetical protein
LNKLSVRNRYTEYNKSNTVCWQYNVKQSTVKEDFKKYGFSGADLSVKDLDFCYIDRTNSNECAEVTRFIERYEWLGKMPVWATHRFAAYYKDVMLAAVVMATPNSFSHLLGKEYVHKEKLISRGATSPLAPDNTASWIIMSSVKWMAENAGFWVFTAYSDPEALELGTVYQACNFYYLGQTFGGNYVYYDPENPDLGWVGTSYFNQRWTIKRITSQAGIVWQPNWIINNASGSKRIINWDAIPEDIVKEIKNIVEEKKKSFKKFKTKPKHKYAYVLGKTPTETRKLRKLFAEKNPDILGLSYPKKRGE